MNFKLQKNISCRKIILSYECTKNVLLEVIKRIVHLFLLIHTTCLFSISYERCSENLYIVLVFFFLTLTSNEQSKVPR